MIWAVTGLALLAVALAAVSLLAGRRAPREFLDLRRQLESLGVAQQEARLELQRAREASLVELGDAARGLHAELSRAQEGLAEVRSLESAGARQLERAAESLRRLEAVVAGSAARGAAGEGVLARALSQLPADLLETNVPFGGRVVEYALRLPGGRLLPIDSKWTSADLLVRLGEEEEPDARRALTDAILRDGRLRLRELSRYLDPERTSHLGMLAVPDAVFFAAPELQAEGFRHGVLVAPYSQALGQLLAVLRLSQRAGSLPEGEIVAERLRTLERSLRRCEEEIEGRLSRALVQAGNARDALRQHQAEAARIVGSLLPDAGAAAATPTPARLTAPPVRS